MKKLNKNLAISILILLVLVLTIWIVRINRYVLKPLKIRQQCFSEAEFDKQAMLEFDETKRQEFIDVYYENCLKRFGINK